MALRPEKEQKVGLGEKLSSLLPERFRREEKGGVQELKKDEALDSYFKIDEAHPEQSPYVKKSGTQTPAGQIQPTAGAAEAKSESFQKVESILEEGLAEIYQSMAAAEQAEFRRKGEEVASQIEQMIVSFKIKARAVLDLIKTWLLIIPRINRHFLEQESKIKTDRIIKLADEYKKKSILEK